MGQNHQRPDKEEFGQSTYDRNKFAGRTCKIDPVLIPTPGSRGRNLMIETITALSIPRRRNPRAENNTVPAVIPTPSAGEESHSRGKKPLLL